MLTSTPCPDLRVYQELTSGRLAVAEMESLLLHLEKCDVCAGKIHTLPASDTLLEWIGQIKSSSPVPDDKRLTPLMQRLIQLAKPAANSSVVLPRTLTFSCSACGKAMRVKEQAAGKKVKCPHCGQVVQAPLAAGTGVSPLDSQTSSPGGMETVDLPSVPSAVSKPGTPSGTPTLATRGHSDKERELCSFLAPAQAADELGRLGSYRVLNVLGAGGMGVVFRAEDTQLQRLVALKAMLPALAANESARQRFLREARLAASLKHDRIVTIHQVGEDRGAPFLAMEFLEGESLEDRLKREGKLPLAEVLRIGREIAEGLQAAHERGLIHRDIKPANVWLEDKRGRVKILDFGLARSSADDVHLTQSGAIVGTPAYMPPEQARGDAVDGRCDLYSLGCVLYRLCTGELPFKGENTMSLLLALAIDQPKSPRDLNPDVPSPLAELILRLLAKDAAQRPATAGEVADALNAIDTGEPVVVKVVRAPVPPQRRRRLAVAVAGGVLALAAMLTIIVIRLGKPEEGSVIIETVDPDVELVFTSGGRNYTVRDKKTGEEIQLPLGAYQVQIKGGKEGLKLETNQFTLKRGERVLVKVTRQAGEKAVEAQAKKQPVQVVDLIDLFQDPDRISAKGFTEKNQWTKAEGKLTYTSDGHSGKVMIPVSLNNVRDYEIDAQVRRLSGNNVFTFDLLTSPTRQTGLDILIGGQIQLGLEGGRRGQIGAWPKKVGDTGRIVTRVRFDADGRHGSVTVTVDGEAAAQWSGELTTIGKPIEFHPNFPGERIPGAFCFRDSFAFSSWQLRVYEGHAQILRPRAPTAPVQIPEPPPLAEWLKGRKVLTVSQDGSGQFKTIQAALNALKPREVVKVLDRGPYRERIEVREIPADTGLISEHGAVLELPSWKTSPPNVLGHEIRSVQGFRLSGFTLTFPKDPGVRGAPGLFTQGTGGLVMEACWVQSRADIEVTFAGVANSPMASDCVRECRFQGRLTLHEGDTRLILRNEFIGPNGHIGIGPGWSTLVIRNNLFLNEFLSLFVNANGAKVLEISNNDFWGREPIVFIGPVYHARIAMCNNLRLKKGLIILQDGAEKDLSRAVEQWQVGRNCYCDEFTPDIDYWKKPNIFPKAPTDILGTPRLLFNDPASPLYLRVAADDPLVHRGMGGAWPEYIGAFPPGPAPKEGDWFTRLRQRWGDVAPAAKPPSPPVQIPEPPPLAEWLKGRTILTVSQDGKSQFKTIQAALDALKPHGVIQVLDRGPYYERLELKNVPQDTGLISAVKTVLELRELQLIQGYREAGRDTYKGHLFVDTDGFRLSGFHFILPSVDELAKLPGGFTGQGVRANRPGGFVLENCKIQEPANSAEWRSLFLGFYEGGSTKPACVRDCFIEGRLGVASSDKDDSASALIEHNYLKDSGKGPFQLMLNGPGSYGTVAIRHNILCGSTTEADLMIPAVEHVKALEVSNNILYSSARAVPILVEAKVPRGAIRFQNNLALRPGFLLFNYNIKKQQVEEPFRTWHVRHNSYTRLLGDDEEIRVQFPQGPGDVLGRIEFLSHDPENADYLRIAADSPLAKAGAGGAWPSYIGALPPGPAPKDGDWFTRLREKWLTDKPATNKKP